MSHNYPYRRPLLNSVLRPDSGPYSTSDRRHAPPDHEFYRPPQEYCSSSFPSSSSSRGVQWPQDGALSILSSCGLEPADLALLAKLPEEVLTVDSLPHVLQQIKGKRGPIAPLASCTPPSSSSSSSPSCSSYPRSSAGVPAANLSATDWDHRCSQPLQYPLDQVTPRPLSSDLDRWGNPRTTGSVRVQPPSSSSSPGSVVDNHHRLGPSEYGKVGRDTGQGPFEDRNSFSSAGGGKRTCASRFSGPGSAPHPEQLHQKPCGGHHESETSSMSSRPAANMPSEPEALDFHGTTPPWYPYSCSLCDITVMSERVWIRHINGAQHADGQLGLLQRFPNWDCRMETVGRTDIQSEKRKDEDKPGQQPQTGTQDSSKHSLLCLTALPANKKSQKKTSDKGKVVCVKFPANSVDEAYLRKLTEPFGKIVKIIMFPSLAFVELGSIDQAKDLVKFHVNYPPTVNGQQMEFRITNTFTFLQSPRVLSFAPAPTEENGQSDLMSVVKRFGSPLYTLFLPSMAFVEMKNTPDAQKLVDYYSSNTLRINNDCIKVSFSGEYKSLMRVASAKKYEEETTKRTRSSSREEEAKMTEIKKKRRTTDQEESSREMKTRSRSRERSTKEKRSRSRERSTEDKNSGSRERKTRTRSTGKSTKEKKSRSRERSTKEETESSRSTDKSSRDERTRTRSKSRERSQNKSSIERRSRSKDIFGRDKRTRIRSKSSEKSSSKKRSRSREESVVSVKTEPTVTEFTTDPDPAPVRESKPEAEEKQQSEEEAESSAEESDIEGMEVIGEDGETLEEDDVKNLDDAELEDEDEEEAAQKNSPAEDKEEKLKDKEVNEEMVEKQEAISEKEQEEGEPIEEKQTSETAETQPEDDEEEPDFPLYLENCITLDKLEKKQTENQDEDDPDEPKSLSDRVIYFRNLPRQPYTDQEFLHLVKDFGTPVRYFHRTDCGGFIEMSKSSEAQRAVTELGIKCVTLKGSKLVVQMSTRYKRLSYGFSEAQVVEERGEHRSRRSKRSERLNKDRSNRKSEGRKESSKNESKSVEEKSPEKESKSKKKSSKTASKNSSESRKSPEKESVCKNTSKETSRAPESGSANKKTSEEESLTETSEEDKTSERKETDENDSVPEDNEEKGELESHKIDVKQELKAAEAQKDKMEIQEKERSEEEKPGPELRASKSPDQQDYTGDSPEPQTEQKPAADWPQQQSESAGGAAELQEPTKPVGTEFVRPVVGYFCNLCQVIYADEDEAKQQHCSSLTHYRKYQEKTCKDPWMS